MPADFYAFDAKVPPEDVRYWLEFPGSLEEGSDLYLLPILGMRELREIGPYEENYEVRRDKLIPNDELSIDEKILLANKIILTIYNSYFPLYGRQRIPKKWFVFSNESHLWLNVKRQFKIPLHCIEGWGIIIDCVRADKEFSCLLKQEGFDVRKIPLKDGFY